MKTTIQLPPASVLWERLSYSPLTGEVIWRACGPNHFKREQDWKRFIKLFAGHTAGHKHSNKNGDPTGIVIKIKWQWYLAHRLIYRMMTGVIPEGMEIDHRNNDPFDNRWTNLRLATYQQNTFNKPSCGRRNSAALGLPKGVFIQNGRFVARMSLDGKQKNIGSFGTLVEAAEAYRSAAAPVHGEFLHSSCSLA